MTITEMTGFFDLLQDKYGSPYFTDDEKSQFLTQAQLDTIAQFLPKEGDELNVERNANTWMIFSPLFFSTTSAMDSAGAVSKSTLETALTTSFGFTVEIIRPLSVTWTDTDGTRPVKGPTRQNNWATYLNNVFKVPVTSEPRYYETNTGYVISPINQSVTITVNGLRYPRAISVDDVQGSELSEIYHNEIVARALELAGVASRDQMMAELQKVNNV